MKTDPSKSSEEKPGTVTEPKQQRLEKFEKETARKSTTPASTQPDPLTAFLPAWYLKEATGRGSLPTKGTDDKD